MSSKKIQLRPHHLLCTQAYQGYGYSKAFTSCMDQLVEDLPSSTVELIPGLDHICRPCPYNEGNNCSTEEKVLRMDQKVLSYFSLAYGEIDYQSTIHKIKEELTKEIFEDLCSTCSWYDYDLCRGKLLK